MRMRSRLIVAAVLLLAMVSFVQGAGFLIYEHGAAAMALAGAFTGLANDPSAVWHNPAGLAWVEGTQVLLGATLIVPRGSVTMDNLPGAPVYNQVKQVFYPPNFYITHKFGDKLAAGVGVFAPFGLGAEWPDEENDFPLRYLAVKAEMQTIIVNGALAYKVTENVAVAGGVYFVTSKLKETLVQRIDMGEDVAFDVPTSLDVKGTALGWNAGLMYKTDGFSLGINFRSQFNVDYSGTVVSSLDYVPWPYQPYIPTEGDAKTTFRFPNILTIGFAVNLTPKVLWSVDVHEYFFRRYNAYTVEVDYPSPYPDQELEAEPRWEDNICYRTGLQYQTSEKLALRGGVLFDKTPQPVLDMSPSLPDADRLAFTLGFGYKIGKLVFDFGYQFEHFYKRTSQHHYIFGPYTPNPAQGTYKTVSHLFGLNLGYRF